MFSTGTGSLLWVSGCWALGFCLGEREKKNAVFEYDLIRESCKKQLLVLAKPSGSCPCGLTLELRRWRPLRPSDSPRLLPAVLELQDRDTFRGGKATHPCRINTAGRPGRSRERPLSEDDPGPDVSAAEPAPVQSPGESRALPRTGNEALPYILS